MDTAVIGGDSSVRRASDAHSSEKKPGIGGGMWGGRMLLSGGRTAEFVAERLGR